MPPALPTSADDAAPPQSKPDGAALLAIDDDEEYNSEEDSDFDINASAELDEDDEGASEPETNDQPRKRRKLTPTRGGDEDGGEDEVDGALDSGDEATIRKAKEKKEKKKRTKGKKGRGDEEDDEGDDFEIDEDDEGGGAGGFVRTRAMKMKMREERKPLAKIDGATVDVDALWAQMNAPVLGSTPGALGKKNQTAVADADVEMADGDPTKLSTTAAPRPGEETITIKRTYKFAGEVITEEKVVPKDSAEAKAHLSSMAATKDKEATDQDNPDEQQDVAETPKANTPVLRRPLQRYSRFDPNPPGTYKRSWVTASTSTPPTPKEQQDAAAAGTSTPATGPKLNTVMKSKLDWATYVDKEGIKDELDVHSRAKEGYMGRMEFLGRVENKKDEERRNARLQGAK